MYYTNACKQCGKEFSVKGHPHQMFCSKECADKSRSGKAIFEQTCEYCGEKFTFGTERLNPKYCSSKCSGLARRKQDVRTCEICGTEFTVDPAAKTRYCSLQCAGVAKRQPVDVTCQYCGKQFQSTPGRKNNLFCSRECKGKAKRKAPMPKTCIHCGETFYVPASKRQREYCSLQCFNSHHSRQVECICEHCGKTYMRHNYRTSRRYCSQECAKRSRKSTSIEIAVESILIDLGVTYETQKHIGNFICDFVVLSHLVIEADGTFWHSLPKAIDRDNRKAALVKSKGYTLLRLPESKITTDLDWCRQQILESL